jgi:hypothetical protein
MMGMGPGMVVCKVHGPGPMHGQGDDMCCRSFFTNEEKAELLGKYKEWLEKEAEGVEEAIERMNRE